MIPGMAIVSSLYMEAQYILVNNVKNNYLHI